MIARWLFPPKWVAAWRVARGRERRSVRQALLRDGLHWLLPAGVQDLLLSISYSARGLDVSGNARLRDRHRGARRVFVIGNGPSLRDMDLSPLAGEIAIGANSFYRHKDAARCGLRYLCIGDERFMIDEPRAVEWHRTIEQSLPGVTLLLHPDARRLVAAHGLYRGNDVHYFRRGVVVPCPELVNFDLAAPINVGNTTGTQLAIPLAIYLGFTEIYLLGFDCNWLESYTGSYHFYERHDQFPEFDALKTDDRWGRYEDHLVFALRDFEAHRLIAERSAALGVRIVNAGRGGLLDMYPRVRFEELFA